jgi:hypothetical protein
MSVPHRLMVMFLLADGTALAQVDGVTVTVTQSVTVPPTLTRHPSSLFPSPIWF